MNDLQPMPSMLPAPDPDRLPWLAEELRPAQAPRRKPFGALLGVAVAVALLLPLFAYIQRHAGAPFEPQTPAPRAVTVGLPPPSIPVDVPPQPIKAEPKAEGSAGVERTIPDVVVPPAASAKPVVDSRKPAPAPKAADAHRATSDLPALDQVVRDVSPDRFPLHFDVWVGAFATRADAKKGWGRLTSIDRSLQHLDAAVVPRPELPSGQMFYRLRLRTESQNKGLALCRQMEMVGQSCIPVGWVG